jgi:hypothetical protein
MKHSTTLAALLLLLGSTTSMAAEPISSAEMCQARLDTHTKMLSETDSGPKANAMVKDLIEVFAHLCQTGAYDQALLVGDTIRGLLATEN